DPHFYIDVTDFVETKISMLNCHQSQLKRGKDSSFSPLQELMLQQCSARGTQSGVKAAEGFQTHSAWKRCSAW
ncbi:MAG: LmbE family protein, partial [Planctomycetaceae bacterium]|nr:LmbE family protein [Planctomycetaceae bacterium]